MFTQSVLMPRAVRRAAALALIVFAVSCDADPTGPPPLLTELPRPLTATESALQSAANTFSFRLLRQLSEADANKNLFFSPLSVSFALGMANSGASGITQQEISQMLGFGSLPEAEVNEAYHSLLELIIKLDPTVNVEIANSVWHDQLFSVRPAFLNTLSTWFGADVFARDFAAGSTVTDINSWVSTRTKGKIPTIIESIDSQEIMFLINAIYFNGDWRKPFDTRLSAAGTFRTADGRDLPVTLMNEDGDDLEFLTNESVVAVNLPYGNGAFAMALIRPATTMSVNNLAESILLQSWNAIRAGFHEGRAMLRVPKFKLEYKRSLGSDLQALGMVRAFNPSLAEFPRIPVTNEQLFVSRVEHRAAVEVDEVGTVAAAATAVGVGITSAPPLIDFNRPFLFLIYEQISGTILFIGKVVELD